MNPSSTSIAPVDRYYAQPHSLDAVGFAFTDLADYQRQAVSQVNRFGQPVEEYELQYLDGDYHRLFNALSISQATLAAWFDLLEALAGDDDRYRVACHLAEDGRTIDEVMTTWDDYFLWPGTATDYARDLVADTAANWLAAGGSFANYIDYESLGRDLALDGAFIEVERDVLLVEW